VAIAACDTADPDQLDTLLAGIDGQHPLTAVIHTAGVLDDATTTALTPDQLHTVLRPKADAAWRLHHATAASDLAAFVLYSSVSGALGGAGQANYAAANTFLDALAAHRRHHGLPATSLAWGLWAHTSDMTSNLDTTNLNRLTRAGIIPLATDHALAILDTALAAASPTLVPIRLNPATLAAHARNGTLPPILATLTRAHTRRAPTTTPTNGSASLAHRLITLSEPEQHHLLLDLVRGHAAAVLGHPTPDTIHPDRPFKDHGFDSLTAVELRNRLTTATGQPLPATLAFDHPTPTALAHHLWAQIVPTQPTQSESLLAELDRIEAAISAIDSGNGEHAKVTARIRGLLWKLDSHQSAAAGNGAAKDDLDSATDDELFAALDSELGAR
jgi:mycoketide-CoA synthase